jgi:hypothetical protein
MPVFDRSPSDWNDLQQMVGQMFAELGCEVSIGQRLETVRGRKEIDVFVRDTSVAPSAQYLCECKFWLRAVPQEVVHSFRTVVADYGAHRGFIISNSGFQKGAFEAAQNTNIDLVNFTQLQSIFEDRWRVAMGHKFMPYADRLFPYWDFPGRKPTGKWGKEQVDQQELLVEAYLPLVQLGPLAERAEFKKDFPMVLPRLTDEAKHDGQVRLTSYREYFDFMDAKKDLSFRQFQVLYGETEQ